MVGVKFTLFKMPKVSKVNENFRQFSSRINFKLFSMIDKSEFITTQTHELVSEQKSPYINLTVPVLPAGAS